MFAATGFEARTRAKSRQRWSACLDEPHLTEFVDCAWAAFRTAVVTGVAIVIFTVLVSVVGDLSSPVRGAVALLGNSLFMARIYLGYWATKAAAGRAFGLAGRRARKLDISSPAALRRSVHSITAPR
jgi:hypothetical protein